MRQTTTQQLFLNRDARKYKAKNRKCFDEKAETRYIFYFLHWIFRAIAAHDFSFKLGEVIISHKINSQIVEDIMSLLQFNRYSWNPYVIVDGKFSRGSVHYEQTIDTSYSGNSS